MVHQGDSEMLMVTPKGLVDLVVNSSSLSVSFALEGL